MYGYAISIPGLAPDVLGRVPSDWSDWVVEVQPKPAEESKTAIGDYFTPDQARLTIRAGTATVHRSARRIELDLWDVGDPALVLHPHLSGPSAAVVRWSGGDAFHAGAFVSDEGEAWVVIGQREDGKSTTMAALHGAGVPVLADDVAAVRGGEVLMGPRSIDMRGKTVPPLPESTFLGSVADRERWRVPLPPIAPAVPLAGFVILRWGALGTTAISDPLARLKILLGCLSLQIPPRSMTDLMALSERPFVELTRPRVLHSLGDVVAELRGLQTATAMVRGMPRPA